MLNGVKNVRSSVLLHPAINYRESWLNKSLLWLLFSYKWFDKSFRNIPNG